MEHVGNQQVAAGLKKIILCFSPHAATARREFHCESLGRICNLRCAMLVLLRSVHIAELVCSSILRFVIVVVF